MKVNRVTGAVAGALLLLCSACSDKGEVQRTEQAATRAETAAKRAETAAGRVEAAAQRAEAAADKAERALRYSSRD